MAPSRCIFSKFYRTFIPNEHVDFHTRSTGKFIDFPYKPSSSYEIDYSYSHLASRTLNLLVHKFH